MPSCLSVLDAIRMRHALRAIIENAIKFSKANSAVEIWTNRSAQRGIVVTVADRGVGIRAEELEKVFIPMPNNGQSETRRRSGAGVGLALAKKYVECHKGQIWLTSKPDVGTTVEIILPNLITPMYAR